VPYLTSRDGLLCQARHVSGAVLLLHDLDWTGNFPSPILAGVMRESSNETSGFLTAASRSAYPRASGVEMPSRSLCRWRKRTDVARQAPQQISHLLDLGQAQTFLFPRGKRKV
jgi:hypothetical protein